MKTEVEIEGVGTYRLPNMYQQHRIKTVQKHNRQIAPLAFGMGMSLQQFKKLPEETKSEIWRAWCTLTAPDNL